MTRAVVTHATPETRSLVRNRESRATSPSARRATTAPTATTPLSKSKVEMDGSSATSTVEVVAESPNEGPVANAGPDQTVDVGDTVDWAWVSGLHNVESGVGGIHDGAFRSGDPAFAPIR